MPLLLCLQQSVGIAANLHDDTQAPDVQTSGYLSLRALQNSSKNSGHSRGLTVTALLKSRAKYDHDLLQMQWRPSLTYTTPPTTRKTSAVVDTLFWEHRLSPVSFIFLGRRKIVNGVAIGRNPSDFFNQNKPQDRTLRDDDRRAEVKGDEMAGWSYFGQSYSIQSLVARPAEGSRRMRAMLQANRNLDSLSTDISFIAYYADRPALGLNISSALGDSTTFYIETGLRKGRDRQIPLLSTDDILTGTVAHRKHWFADIVAGGQYTMANGTTLGAEYWRNNHGFSNREYAGIAKSLRTGQGNPHLAASLVGTPGLRRNSILMRLDNIPLPDAAKGEITWIRNMDDASLLLHATVHWDISEIDSLRFGVDHFSGTPLSEYGASRINKRFFLVYQRYF